MTQPAMGSEGYLAPTGGSQTAGQLAAQARALAERLGTGALLERAERLEDAGGARRELLPSETRRDA